MTLAQLLQPLAPVTSGKISLASSVLKDNEKASDAGHTVSSPPPQPRIRIDALRLIELTARTSVVLESKESKSPMRSDPVISIFPTFGYLNRLLVLTVLSVVNYDDFPNAVAEHWHVRELESDMLIVRSRDLKGEIRVKAKDNR